MPAHKLPDGQAARNKAEYDKKWRDENRARVNALATERRRKADPEKEKEKKRQAYLRNRDKALAYAEKYRAENKEKIKNATAPKNAEYVRRYRERHYEKSLQMTQAWKDANPARRAATNAAWTQRNLDKHRTYQHNRRGQKNRCGGTLSPGLADRLLILQKGKCACCRKSLKDGFEMDHIVPLSKGGRNIDSNIQLLTPTCNRSKGAKDPIAFMQEKRGMLL